MTPRAAPSRLFCIGVALIVASSVSLIAQTAPQPAAPPAGKDEPVELSPFAVTSNRDIGFQSTNAAEVTRMNTPIRDIPMNVTILNQEFIEDTMARTTEDVLQYVTGFVSTSNNDSWVVRGLANANTTFLNGFLQTESIGTVSVANVERVEVLKGPAAVLFGQGGYAATVNRVTKRPKEKAATIARASYGPNKTQRFEMDTSSPIGGAGSPVGFRLTGVWDDGEYWRKISHEEKAVSAVVAWKISPKTRLSLEALYVNEIDGGAVWRQPMMLGEPRGIRLPDGTFLDYGESHQGYSSPGDIRDWKRMFSMLDFQHEFSRHLQLRIQFVYDTKDQLYDETQPEQGSLTILKDAVFMPKRWRVRTQDTNNYRSRNELLSEFNTGPASHRLLVGFSWVQTDSEIWNRDGIYNRGGLAANSASLNSRWPTANVGSRYNVYPNLNLAEFLTDVRLAGFNPNMVTPVNVFNPKKSPAVPTKENRPPLPLGVRNLDDIKNTEYYANDIVSFMEQRLFVTGGLRHTITGNKRVNGLTSAVVTDGQRDSTTFSTGIVYHLNAARTYTLYANANSSFLPIFQQQSDGTPLDPEEGKQKEVGFRFSLRDNRIQGIVSLYEIKQRNVAVPDANSPGDFLQLDGVCARGVECSLNARMTERWSVFGGYAYTDARDSRSHVRTQDVPYHAFSAFNSYRFTEGGLKGLMVSLGSIFVGERPIDRTPITTLGGIANAPIWTIPAEWRFDFVTRYRLPLKGKVQYDLGLKVQNIANNNQIYKLADTVSLQRQPGRTIQATLAAKF